MMKTTILGAIAVSLMPAGLAAQGFPGMAGLPMGAAGAVGMGQMALESFPEIVDEALGPLSDAEGRLRTKSPEACLSTLQGIVNIGAMAANLLPFNSAGAYEGTEGYVGRVRALVDGKQINIELYCEEAELVTTQLEWRQEIEDDIRYERSTLDAALGVALVAAMDGVFTEEGGSLFLSDTDVPAGAGAGGNVGKDLQLVRDLSPEQDELFTMFSMSMDDCWDTEGLEADDLEAGAILGVPLGDDKETLPDQVYVVAGESQALRESALASIDECVGSGRAPIELPDEWVAVHLEFSSDGVAVFPASLR